MQMPDLFVLLKQTALFLWKDWPMDMQVVPVNIQGSFNFVGTCPYAACRAKSVFIPVGSPSQTQIGEDRTSGTPILRVATAMQCQGCRDYILGVVDHPLNRLEYSYVTHQPHGAPDDTVSEYVPKVIAADFSEALRCHWVNGYNATGEMCRRALESSCLELGAPANLGTLEKMIDWVHGQGKITKPLCEMAHKVRLGGDRCAHPSERIMSREDADAVIEFTREYLDHVYVMPAKMAKFNFDRPKPQKALPVPADSEVKSE